MANCGSGPLAMTMCMCFPPYGSHVLVKDRCWRRSCFVPEDGVGSRALQLLMLKHGTRGGKFPQ